MVCVIYFSGATLTAPPDYNPQAALSTQSADPPHPVVGLCGVNYQFLLTDKQSMVLWILIILTVSMYFTAAKGSKYYFFG